MAVLLVQALPEDVTIDRLILVAPAISRDFPLDTAVLPHVREFIVNYASASDFTVGWGTACFGTIDRRWEASAGARGFALEHPRLVEWHWSRDVLRNGHYGNHLSYLSARWQRAYLLPAIDPSVGAAALREGWAAERAAPTKLTHNPTNSSD